MVIVGCVGNIRILGGVVAANSLMSIESLMASASDPDLRSEHMCRLGIGLAQIGRIDEASQILEQLRAYLSSSYALIVLIRTMILEAIIPYYRDFLDYSDRLRRAHALASAARIEDLRAEVSVWSAHISFNFDNFDNFHCSLKDAFDRFVHLDYSHRARLSLLIADGLQFLGQRKSAAEWYGIARNISRYVHDHGLMVAIEFNRVAMGLSHIRLQRALGRNYAVEEERNWLLELSSVKNLHHGFGSQALLEVLDLCEAHAMEIQGRYLDAAKRLTRVRDAGGLHRCGVSERLANLEIIWCEVKAGHRTVSIEWIEQEYDVLLAMTQNDRLLAMHFLRDIINAEAISFDQAQIDSMIRDSIERLEGEYQSLTNVLAPIHRDISVVAENCIV